MVTVAGSGKLIAKRAPAACLPLFTETWRPNGGGAAGGVEDGTVGGGAVHGAEAWGVSSTVPFTNSRCMRKVHVPDGHGPAIRPWPSVNAARVTNTVAGPTRVIGPRSSVSSGPAGAACPWRVPGRTIDFVTGVVIRAYAAIAVPPVLKMLSSCVVPLPNPPASKSALPPPSFDAGGHAFDPFLARRLGSQVSTPARYVENPSGITNLSVRSWGGSSPWGPVDVARRVTLAGLGAAGSPGCTGDTLAVSVDAWASRAAPVDASKATAHTAAIRIQCDGSMTMVLPGWERGP
jgi:hypothetical protein